jgi:hypothetical protein
MKRSAMEKSISLRILKNLYLRKPSMVIFSRAMVDLFPQTETCTCIVCASSFTGNKLDIYLPSTGADPMTTIAIIRGSGISAVDNLTIKINDGHYFSLNAHIR